ncbi:MAG TPA: CocE/NonD family hydrolase [Syntrophorhabdaceae bacterium]|nr:CocE/NonD family hydrolase [Syntrophorhabdaceae bacterium]HPU30045.1 CocE/NonD family hydrolase [Syntrophorhabdaceae bacterium]
MSTKRVYIGSQPKLDAILNEQDGKKGVVICHPHPLYGGSMHNNVINAMEKGFYERGFTTLKFNFRGVGRSEGTYDEGIGEIEDVMGAVNFLRENLKDNASIVLSGYSFGAWVSIRAALKLEDVESIFIVAYPFSVYDSSPLKQFKGKMWFIAGKYDEIAPVEPLLNLYKELSLTEKSLKIIESDHFFLGKEDEITQFIKEAF